MYTHKKTKTNDVLSKQTHTKNVETCYYGVHIAKHTGFSSRHSSTFVSGNGPINSLLCLVIHVYVPFDACIAGQAELRFGDRVVRNNSYILAGDIPGSAEESVNALLCASDTTNPATRQWYDRDGDALGDAVLSDDDDDTVHGTYQAIDSASGGVLLYRVGNQEAAGAGLHYCRISDSSGNIQTLNAGLYTIYIFYIQSGRANGKVLLMNSWMS